MSALDWDAADHYCDIARDEAIADDGHRQRAADRARDKWGSEDDEEDRYEREMWRDR